MHVCSLKRIFLLMLRKDLREMQWEFLFFRFLFRNQQFSSCTPPLTIAHGSAYSNLLDSLCRNIDGLTGCVVIYLSDELALFTCFVRLVHLCDPDMLVGWEIQGFSLGLLAERAANLGFGILKQLSRIPPRTKAASNNGSAAVSGMQQLQNSLFGGSKVVPLETVGINDPIIEDEWGRTHGSGIFVGGRVVLNLWRIMRGEVKLGIYTLEAVAEAVLRRRVPRIPWCTLTRWFRQGPASGRFRCIEYFVDRARLNFEIMDQLDLVQAFILFNSKTSMKTLIPIPL
jgi:DNA polymerase zeta